MKAVFLSILGYSLLLAGCSQTSQPVFPNKTKDDPTPALLTLGSLSTCKNYSGLPDQWRKNNHAGMVWVDSGTVNLGSNLAYPDEINFGEKSGR